MTTTQPQAAAAKQVGNGQKALEIPPIVPPMCTRVWTRPAHNDGKSFDAEGKLLPPGAPPLSILWALDQKHPYLGDYKIVRMFALRGTSVEFFAVNEKDGRLGIQFTLPWEKVDCVEHVMNAPDFIAEILHVQDLSMDEVEEEIEDTDEPDETEDGEELQPLPPAAGQG